MAPIIKLSPQAELKLTAWAIATGGYPTGTECSGLGLIEREGKEVFHVVDVDLLGVGSPGFTEFSGERAMTLPEDPRRKLWWHRHPVASWSATDEHTCTKEPLGTSPQLVQWSVAIVLTPSGWIGRVDLHVPKSRTFHCPVEPKTASKEVLEEAKTLLTPELVAYCSELKAEYEALRSQEVRFYPAYLQDETLFDIDEYEVPVSGEVYCDDCGIAAEYQGGEDIYGVLGLEAYVCKGGCGKIILIADPHSCDLYTLQDAPVRRKRRDWMGSFNRWMGRRK